jgi:multidrug resistance efflux pump
VDPSERAPSAPRIIGRGLGVLIVVGAVVAGLFAYRQNFVNPRTDDAAVRANVVGIAPQVSGPIVELRVVDNEAVKQGDLLFAIDCRPYEARVARARADLALARKEVEAQRRAIDSAGRRAWPAPPPRSRVGRPSRRSPRPRSPAPRRSGRRRRPPWRAWKPRPRTRKTT